MVSRSACSGGVRVHAKAQPTMARAISRRHALVLTIVPSVLRRSHDTTPPGAGGRMTPCQPLEPMLQSGQAYATETRGRRQEQGDLRMNDARPWLASSPAGVPAEIDPDQFSSLPQVLQSAIDRYRDNPAFSNLGKTLTYGEIDRSSAQLAAYLLGELGLKKGDRVAIMMPNCLQYPISTFGILRAGLTVVNVNPMYTPRELKHQLVDSGAVAILVVDNFGRTVQDALAGTQVKQVITTGLGDLLGFPRSEERRVGKEGGDEIE